MLFMGSSALVYVRYARIEFLLDTVLGLLFYFFLSQFHWKKEGEVCGFSDLVSLSSVCTPGVLPSV